MGVEDYETSELHEGGVLKNPIYKRISGNRIRKYGGKIWTLVSQKKIRLAGKKKPEKRGKEMGVIFQQQTGKGASPWDEPFIKEGVTGKKT